MRENSPPVKITEGLDLFTSRGRTKAPIGASHD